MNGKYTVIIEVLNEDSGERVAKTSLEFTSLDRLEEEFGDIERWVSRYDAKSFWDCTQCGKTKHLDELSESDNDNNLYCQDCLEKIKSGELKVEGK